MPELVDPSSLFIQLQTRYPTSSLLTEFVQVHEGSFVVRALVQVSGTTLATSLAAAATIELAEDQARLRVLKLLGIPSAPMGTLANLPAAKHPMPAPPLSSPLENGSLLASAPLKAGTSQEVSGAPDSLGTPPASIAATVPSFLETPPPPISPLPVETPPEPKRSPTPKVRKTAVPSLDEGMEPSFEVEEPLTASMATSVMPEPLDEPSHQSLMDAESEPAVEENPPLGEPADLSELIALTDVEMQRVGWNRKRGQTHLKQTYGKDKRADLDEEQLLEFLHFLRALPSRYETPFKE